MHWSKLSLPWAYVCQWLCPCVLTNPHMPSKVFVTISREMIDCFVSSYFSQNHCVAKGGAGNAISFFWDVNLTTINWDFKCHAEEKMLQVDTFSWMDSGSHTCFLTRLCKGQWEIHPARQENHPPHWTLRKHWFPWFASASGLSFPRGLSSGIYIIHVLHCPREHCQLIIEGNTTCMKRSYGCLPFIPSLGTFQNFVEYFLRYYGLW